MNEAIGAVMRRSYMSAVGRTVAALVIIGQAPGPAAADSAYEYEPAIVNLMGRLKLEPMAAEAGAIVDAPVLSLYEAIDTVASPHDAANPESLSGVWSVQLEFHGLGDFTELAGGCVIASGALFQRRAPHHVTPVVMRVRHIQNCAPR